MRSSPSGPQRRERNAALGCSAWARPCCWQRRIEWSSQTGVRPGGRVRFADRSRSDLFIWHVHGFRRACRRVRRPRAAVGARMTVAPVQPGHVCSRPCVDGLVATRRLLPPRAERSHPRRAHGPDKLTHQRQQCAGIKDQAGREDQGRNDVHRDSHAARTVCHAAAARKPSITGAPFAGALGGISTR